jgi:hypothetical protein
LFDSRPQLGFLKSRTTRRYGKEAPLQTTGSQRQKREPKEQQEREREGKDRGAKAKGNVSQGGRAKEEGGASRRKTPPSIAGTGEKKTTGQSDRRESQNPEDRSGRQANGNSFREDSVGRKKLETVRHHPPFRVDSYGNLWQKTKFHIAGV